MTTAARPRSWVQKKKRLLSILKTYDPLVVAFSGGVDSTFLLAAAKEALADRVTAVTADSRIHSRREIREASEMAQALGVRHITLPLADEMKAPEFIANSPDRCYTCKQLVFGEIKRIAAEMGVHRMAHGVNLDDLKDYRPGLKAADEMGLAAPLLEAGLTKADIRMLSRRMGLPTWNKPSMACLASRIPYGRPITEQALQMVEAAEEVLYDLGFSGCRVRFHGEVARIETNVRDLGKVVRPAVRSRIVREFKAIGFTHVGLDLEGYVSGSLNRTLENMAAAGLNDSDRMDNAS
jgi:pyridinium-3,5-biscarboxylic acid mononucleotide sulfurtransferase